MTQAANGVCPCGGGSYLACCGRYHAGEAVPSAEALMRSRYAAYVLGLWNYLRSTWHASTRPVQLAVDDGPTAWLGLRVKRCESSDECHATVEFVARYKVGGKAFRLHEISRFLRDDGRWYYLDGRFPEA